MFENGSITDKEERHKLEYLLNTKRWNPYRIRHSSIISDCDYLPEYALKKKAPYLAENTYLRRLLKLHRLLKREGMTIDNNIEWFVNMVKTGMVSLQLLLLL
jgi:hypothetical protein